MSLADYIGPGSHDIPYHLTDAEQDLFLERHAYEEDFLNYLRTRMPPWGVIIKEGETPSEFLVWYDARGVLHIVDVTFMPISKSIQDAIYTSPTAAAIDDMLTQIKSLPGIMVPVIQNLLFVGGVIAFFLILREIKH